ncbi:hypothetical protein [Neolewinella antarctica]|uniref:Lipoprotein n=1 Tax=Neolewinella antarctica TaxID=442734 RepID=A0ABX0X8G2_9BACT|nr:hypothetical protein [Neolewinella antarctica]NJC25512.1 hypothetical protein [Neolewinella antarctica]
MNNLLVAILLVCALSACDDAESEFVLDPTYEFCGQPVTVAPANTYEARAEVAILTIHAVNGTCLDISYGGSGCSATDVIAELFADGAVAESNPTQSRATLRFYRDADQPICQAVFERRDTFDLAPYLGNTLPSLLEIGDTTVLISK